MTSVKDTINLLKAMVEGELVLNQELIALSLECDTFEAFAKHLATEVVDAWVEAATVEDE